MGLDVGLADRVVINEEPLGSSRMICMLFISWVCMGLHIPIIFCVKALHMNTRPVAKVYFNPCHKLNKYILQLTFTWGHKFIHIILRMSHGYFEKMHQRI